MAKGRSRLGCLARVAALFGALGLGGAAVLGILAVIAVVAAVLGYRYVIVDHPGAEFDRAHIQAIIADDSPVTYNDGVTRLGVFFTDEHREQLDWTELPDAYIVAIIAAEDQDYWSHGGVSVAGITGALARNLLAGGFTSGGSTLTQQTAKNLYDRPDRSLRSKLIELENALKLEAHYTKPEILTFYANQFHVTGNGRGLGVAARHFFDRDVSEIRAALTDEAKADEALLINAFLAGLVKGPTNYDPFFSNDPDKKARATERAHDRTRYVLRRIVEEDASKLAGGPLPSGSAGEPTVAALKARAERLLASGFVLPFRQGVFRYDSNIVLDEIAARLAQPPFAEALTRANIADPASAGLQVITTLDADTQREAQYGLWHHLTEVGTMLEARGAKDFVLADTKAPRALIGGLVPHSFHVARVAALVGDAGQRHLELDLGGTACTADRDAIARAALMAYRGLRKDKNAKVSGAWIDQFAGALPADSVVWVSVRTAAPARCDLELHPTLQGAVVVVQDGQVRAMVGGNDNRNFNRALAPRQMGSTFKPLVYHVAMAHGWLPSDVLDNRPQVFPFGGTFYWPTSDHVPPPAVSMAWAGVNSENLASVWLLYHLADRVGPNETVRLATELGLFAAPGEAPEAWKARLRKAGVDPTSRVGEARYLRARYDVLGTIATSAHPEDEGPLRSLLFGSGFGGEARRVAADREDGAWKSAALQRSFTGLQDLVPTCLAEWEAAQHRRGEAPHLFVNDDGGGRRVACAVDAPPGFHRIGATELAIAEPEPDEATLPVAPPPPPPPPPPGGRRKPKGQPLPPRPPVRPTPTGPWSTPAPVWGAGPAGATEDLLLGGELHLSTLRAVEAAIAAAPPTSDPWAAETLTWTQDFRVLLAIEAVVATAADYGVATELRKGLPLPLGASEITLEELTSVYDGVTTGAGWSFPGVGGGLALPEPGGTTLLVSRILDIDGGEIYAANPERHEIASPAVAAMTADILVNVVRHGTARRALNTVRDGKGGVPMGGKTGTTNDYKNAAFAGFVPHADGPVFSRAGGYAIGVYVGYDDNRPMDVGNLKLAGANGALPAWLWVAQGLAASGRLGRATGPAPGGGWELGAPSALTRAAVEVNTGLPGSGASVLTGPRPEGEAVVVAVEGGSKPWRNRRKPEPAAKRDPAVAVRRKGLWK